VQHIRERERVGEGGGNSLVFAVSFETMSLKFFNGLWSSGCEFVRYKYFNRSSAHIFRVRKNKLKIQLFMMLHWCGWGSLSSVI